MNYHTPSGRGVRDKTEKSFHSKLQEIYPYRIKRIKQLNGFFYCPKRKTRKPIYNNE
jgi:hypothetical protein